MDVVYVLKETGDYKELLYSLRSLKNIHYNNVYIVGGKPYWIQNIIHIPFTERVGKYNDVRRKYEIICDIEELSDNFIFMNDDFYFLKPQKVEYYKMGTLKNHYEYVKTRVGVENNYTRTIENLYKKYPKGDSFETHTPIIYNKQKLKKILGCTGIRTVYCNTYKIKGKELVCKDYINSKLIKDCKIYSNNIEVEDKQLLLSSSDGLSLAFYNFIDNIFTDKSIFEKKSMQERKNELIAKLPLELIGRPNQVVNRFGKRYEANDEGKITIHTQEELEIFIAYGFIYEDTGEDNKEVPKPTRTRRKSA